MIFKAVLFFERLYCRTALGKAFGDVLRNTFNIHFTVSATICGNTNGIDFALKCVAVNFCNELLVLKNEIIVQRRPMSVLALGHIGHHTMGMQMRIQIARCIMAKRSANQIHAGNGLHFTIHLHAGLGKVLLYDCQSCRNGFVMSLDNPAIAVDKRGNRGCLGGVECPVQTRTVAALPAHLMAHALCTVRCIAFHDPLEFLRVCLPARTGAARAAGVTGAALFSIRALKLRGLFRALCGLLGRLPVHLPVKAMALCGFAKPLRRCFRFGGPCLIIIVCFIIFAGHCARRYRL